MKRYSLLLFILSFATLQASQISKKELINNTNEQSENSSTYTHGQQQDWGKWINDVKYEDLQKPLIQLYRNGVTRPTAHITTTQPVYFFVGPTGAGKSTSIFALQGNEVNKRKQKKFNNSDSESEEANAGHEGKNIYKGKLILKKTVKVYIPKIGGDIYGVTEGVKVYYTGKKIKTPMAFCDTEGFGGQRKDKISKAEKILGAFATHFALKGNPIGGIVFLVSSADIIGSRGKNFLECVNFLKNYFDKAITNKNREILKKSIMLLINKSNEDEEESTAEKLANFIKKAYEDYYKGLSKNNRHSNSRLGPLKPFFSLFLKKDIAKNQVNKVDFFKLLDKKKVRFFYPYQPKNVIKIREKLLDLTPLGSEYLSLQDNELSQYLIQQIMDRAYAINQVSYKVMRHNSLVLQNLLHIQKNKNELDAFREKKRKEQKKLDKENKRLGDDKTLECVYYAQHIEDVPFDRKEKMEQRIQTYRKKLDEQIKPVKDLLSKWKNKWENFTKMQEFKKQVYKDYDETGYLCKNFIYTSSQPIYKIVTTVCGLNNVFCIQPKYNDLKKQFKIKEDFDKANDVIVSQVTLISRNQKGIKSKKWHFVHRTSYEQNARCYIQFFSQKSSLQPNERTIEDNKKKIEHIDNLIKQEETLRNKKRKDLQQACDNNKKKADRHIEKLSKLQEEMSMIAFWSYHILKENGSNKKLVRQYINDYNTVMPNEYQIFIDDKTNGKHSDNQPGQQLRNNYQRNEKDVNNHNNNSLSLSFSSSMTLGTIGILSSLKKKN